MSTFFLIVHDAQNRLKVKQSKMLAIKKISQYKKYIQTVKLKKNKISHYFIRLR